MQRLRIILVLALAGIWFPLTLHCALENLPGWEFLSCCSHPEEAHPHQDADCDHDGCSVVEMGGYRLEENPPAIDPPLLSFAQWIAALPPAAATIEAAAVLPVPPCPLELATAWQFRWRAASSARAPNAA